MDSLKQTLLAREVQPRISNPIVQPEGGMPTATPSKPQQLPPAWQRFLVSQKMQSAYRTPNWQPNPILLRILGK